MDRNDSNDISLAVYLEHHSTRHPIYIITLALVLLTIVSLPLMVTEVSVGSPGILRPVMKVTPVKAYASGVILETHASENMRVSKGSVLFKVRAIEWEERQNRAQRRLVEVKELINDVENLSRLVSEYPSAGFHWKPVTELYTQSLVAFRQQMRDAGAQLEKARRDHARSDLLFKGGAIAASEMENSDEVLRQAKETAARVVQSQLTEWRQMGQKYREEAADIEHAVQEARRMEASTQIVAPVGGTLHHMTGLYPGSPVFSGQEVGYISPDTTLVAEVHVAPGDIGLIQLHQPVRIQVMAFNYNEWGLLNGEVCDIGADIVMSEDRGHYVVLCTLSQTFLETSKSYRGMLRKGMSIHARFVVGRRSLWQLLYDNIDDWLNPVRGQS